MDQSLSQLSELDKFIVARWAYSVGKPLMDDTTYNVLYKSIENMYPDSEYLKHSWSDDTCPTDLLKSINRDDLIQAVILSDRTESIPSLNTDQELQNELQGANVKGTLSMKHDGWNIQANYYNGSLVSVNTRGRSSDFVDVTPLAARLPTSLPYKDKCKVIMELTISKNNFRTCAQLFGNVSPRSAVSTVLARPEYYHLLSMHAFDIHGINLTECKFKILTKLGFDIPAYVEVVTFGDILQGMRELSAMEPSYESPTDGMVYDGVKRRAIRLLAWEEPVYTSFVTGYIEQFGPNRISPSLEIYPVLRKGSTQKQINITNWQRIMDFNLQPGAPVAFRIAASATADFDEELTRLKHKEWEGRWKEFQNQVKEREDIARCRQMQSIL